MKFHFFGVLILLLSLSACNCPDRSTPISSLPQYGYTVTGAFKNGLALDVETKSGSTLYVQNGKFYTSLSQVNPRESLCSLYVRNAKIGYKEILDTYHITRVAFSKVDSFFKQEGTTEITLYKNKNVISLKMSDDIYSLDVSPQLPVTIIGLSIEGDLNCRDPRSGKTETIQFTAGDLMDIFQFKYIWKAPAL